MRLVREAGQGWRPQPGNVTCGIGFVSVCVCVAVLCIVCVVPVCAPCMFMKNVCLLCVYIVCVFYASMWHACVRLCRSLRAPQHTPRARAHTHSHTRYH